MDVDKWVAATRPLVTLILIVTLCWIVLNNVDQQSIDFKDFLNLVMIVALFWFKSRDEEKRASDIATTANHQVADAVVAKIGEIQKDSAPKIT